MIDLNMIEFLCDQISLGNANSNEDALLQVYFMECILALIAILLVVDNEGSV